MKLDWIEYAQHQGEDSEWIMKDIHLQNVNLFVGPNATGKSRTLHSIQGLATILSQPGPLKFRKGRYSAHFTSEETQYQYSIEFDDSQVIEEELTVDGQVKLKRTKDGDGELYYEGARQNLKLGIEPNLVAVNSKRDREQHPFLEEMCAWGQQAALYHFGSDMGRNSFSASKQLELEKVGFGDENRVIDYFLLGEAASDKFNSCVLADMNAVGYELERITVLQGDLPDMPPLQGPDGTPLKALVIKEKGVKALITQHNISQGMFRALSILIHANYILSSHSPSMVLIDDIGEGMDHRRSKLLIKLLVEKFADSACQLIMSTNDQFVMDAIDLKYWNVIVRKGSTCRVINEVNTPERFKEFRFMGLSNFEFFAMDFFLEE